MIHLKTGFSIARRTPFASALLIALLALLLSVYPLMQAHVRSQCGTYDTFKPLLQRNGVAVSMLNPDLDSLLGGCMDDIENIIARYDMYSAPAADSPKGSTKNIVALPDTLLQLLDLDLRSGSEEAQQGVVPALLIPHSGNEDQYQAGDVLELFCWPATGYAHQKLCVQIKGLLPTDTTVFDMPIFGEEEAYANYLSSYYPSGEEKEAPFSLIIPYDDVKDENFEFSSSYCSFVLFRPDIATKDYQTIVEILENYGSCVTLSQMGGILLQQARYDTSSFQTVASSIMILTLLLLCAVSTAETRRRISEYRLRRACGEGILGPCYAALYYTWLLLLMASLIAGLVLAVINGVAHSLSWPLLFDWTCLVSPAFILVLASLTAAAGALLITFHLRDSRRKRLDTGKGCV